MLKKFTVKFRIHQFWVSPGSIVFNEEHLELIFLGKTKMSVNYIEIINVKVLRYFLEKRIIVSTKDRNVYLIPGLNFRKVLEQFISLGFTIEG